MKKVLISISHNNQTFQEEYYLNNPETWIDRVLEVILKVKNKEYAATIKLGDKYLDIVSLTKVLK